MNVQQYLTSQSLPYRGDCIRCGNKNTLSASLIDGFVIFNCYHTNCNLRGKYKYEYDINSIRFYSSNTCAISNMGVQNGTIIPPYFTSPLQNPQCFNFMKRWNLIEPYVEGRISLYYDPRQHRCVFLIKDHKGEIQGATGRSLSYTINPRWFIYDRQHGCPYIVNCKPSGQFRIAIVVEDPISAVRVSYVYDGLALLGTNIPNECIPYLVQYSRLFVALDADATSKSLKLQHQLYPYVDTKIIALKQDIKYYSNQQLEELRKEINWNKSFFV